MPLILGAVKGYAVAAFAGAGRAPRKTPQVATKIIGKEIHQRSIRHSGYAICQQRRKMVEEVFGCIKTIAGIRPTNSALPNASAGNSSLYPTAITSSAFPNSLDEHGDETVLTLRRAVWNGTQAEHAVFDRSHAALHHGCSGTLDELATFLCGA